MNDAMQELFAVLEARRDHPAGTSYTAALLAEGPPKIAQKVGEEAVEVVVAALSQGADRVVEETADLIYHLLVLLVSQELQWHDVEKELSRRRRPD